MTAQSTSPPTLSELTALYTVEENAVQQKATHVLTIRSLAISVLAGAAAGVRVYPGKGLEFLVIALVPFYLLDFVYDAYLIPIAQRETAVRELIASRLAETPMAASLATNYRFSVQHRVTPTSWNPFLRAALEPVRLTFYIALVIAFILITVL